MKIGFKKSLANTVTIIAVAALIFGIAATRTTKAEVMPAVSFWIEPQLINITTYEYNVGDMFNATVWVNTYEDAENYDSFTWQAMVTFNDSLLMATRMGYTNGSVSEFFSGHTTVPVSPVITNTSAYTGETLMGTDTRPPGNGSLCWVEFQILMEPTGSEVITTTLDIDNVDTFLLDGDLMEITSTKYSGEYYYIVPEYTMALLVIIMAVSAVSMIMLRKKIVRIP